MYNNSLHRFHSFCYKKITREYRLVRDFNFIILNEVSQSILLRCTRTNILVNKFSNLSAHVQCSTFLSSCWDSTWFTIMSKKYDDASEDTFYQVEELHVITFVDSSFVIT